MLQQSTTRQRQLLSCGYQLSIFSCMNLLLLRRPLTVSACSNNALDDIGEIRENSIDCIKTCKYRDDVCAGVCITFRKDTVQKHCQGLMSKCKEQLRYKIVPALHRELSHLKVICRISCIGLHIGTNAAFRTVMINQRT